MTITPELTAAASAPLAILFARAFIYPLVLRFVKAFLDFGDGDLHFEEDTLRFEDEASLPNLVLRAPPKS